MKKLRYRSLQRTFRQFDDIDEIKETFGIPPRKNIYRVAPGGELFRLNGENITSELKDNDIIEAVSEFILG